MKWRGLFSRSRVLAVGGYYKNDDSPLESAMVVDMERREREEI